MRKLQISSNKKVFAIELEGDLFLKGKFNKYKHENNQRSMSDSVPFHVSSLTIEIPKGQ